jgi:hypothetical protein
MSAYADNRGSANLKYRNDYFNSLHVNLVFNSTSENVRWGSKFQASRRNGIVINTVVPPSLKISSEAASP